MGGWRRILGTAVVAAALAPVGGPSSAALADGPAVPILIYHHISAVPDSPSAQAHAGLYVSRAAFAAQIGALARAGYRGVTLEQMWASWHGGPPLPPRPVVVSFDDGFASQYVDAAPLLRRRGWPAVLNLTLSQLRARGGLTRRRVRRLIRQGWEVDAHTLTHPDLTTLDPARLQAEVAGSRAAIRRIFHVPADFFCYPYGRTNPAVEAAVQAAGFLAATTIAGGLASAATPPLELPRLYVAGQRTPGQLLDQLAAAAGGQPAPAAGPSAATAALRAARP